MIYVLIGFIILLSFIIFPFSTFFALILVYLKANSWVIFSIIFITFFIDLYRLNNFFKKNWKYNEKKEAEIYKKRQNDYTSPLWVNIFSNKK